MKEILKDGTCVFNKERFYKTVGYELTYKVVDLTIEKGHVVETGQPYTLTENEVAFDLPHSVVVDPDFTKIGAK